MSKKNFGKGIDALFSSASKNIEKAIVPNKKSSKVKEAESSKQSERPGAIHKLTCNLDFELYEKLKAISHSAAVPVKDVVTKSLEDFISKIEPEEITEALKKMKEGANKYGL